MSLYRLELELELVYFIVKQGFTLLKYYLLLPIWRNVIGLIL